MGKCWHVERERLGLTITASLKAVLDDLGLVSSLLAPLTPPKEAGSDLTPDNPETRICTCWL